MLLNCGVGEDSWESLGLQGDPTSPWGCKESDTTELNWTQQKYTQNGCTILDAWGWCIGTTQRDGMGREEGGGFRMGNTCIPVVDSFWYTAKPIQYCKVKK